MGCSIARHYVPRFSDHFGSRSKRSTSIPLPNAGKCHRDQSVPRRIYTQFAELALSIVFRTASPAAHRAQYQTTPILAVDPPAGRRTWSTAEDPEPFSESISPATFPSHKDRWPNTMALHPRCYRRPIPMQLAVSSRTVRGILIPRESTIHAGCSRTEQNRTRDTVVGQHGEAETSCSG